MNESEYLFETEYPIYTNSLVMSEYLINHCEYKLLSADGTYAEVITSYGVKLGVHAGGNGDNFNHKIRFEVIG